MTTFDNSHGASRAHICEIQWIDMQTCKPTPDTNPAIGFCTCPSADEGRGTKRVFAICADHAKRLPKSWMFWGVEYGR
jgi:hypothetical protein